MGRAPVSWAKPPAAHTVSRSRTRCGVTRLAGQAESVLVRRSGGGKHELPDRGGGRKRSQ